MKLGDIRNEKEDSFDLTFYKLWSFWWNQIENGILFKCCGTMVCFSEIDVDTDGEILFWIIHLITMWSISIALIEFQLINLFIKIKPKI